MHIRASGSEGACGEQAGIRGEMEWQKLSPTPGNRRALRGIGLQACIRLGIRGKFETLLGINPVCISIKISY